MKQISSPTSELNKQILDFCRHIAGSANIIAIAQVDTYSMGAGNEKAIIQITIVINNFQPRIMSYIKNVKDTTIFVLAIDQWVLERDIDIGLLGEAIAGKLVFPYMPLQGQEYLHKKEIALKKRLILELLQNLAISFPELAESMQIKPQYFLYEVLLNRIRVFPLLAYDFSNLVNMLSENETEALGSYNEALKELETEGKIYHFNGYLMISKKLIRQCQDPRIWLINLTKNAPRTIFSSFFGVFPQLVKVVSQNTEAFLKARKINWRVQPELSSFYIDPQKYVFFQTASGLLSLSDKVDIKSFAQKMLSSNCEDIEVEPVGGMLNDVYLIKAHANGSEMKVLAKRFKDWSGFKWFPLTLWSFGARPFVVSGQGRLAKECAISELLRSKGFNVPKVLHVSNAERLIFMEYIDGENLTQAIKRIATAENGEPVEAELALLTKAGETLAEVHAHNITLGDTKPENMLVKQDGTIYMIDFEQATQDGDKTWDVAVFLYYCGHYIQPFNGGNHKAECITQAFINGYLKAGGNCNTIQEAGLYKYTRVFSIFTMWSIISTIANICEKTEALQQESAW